MRKHETNPQRKRQDKGNHFTNQFIRVLKAFESKPSTMLMVSVRTGILRTNICRYVAKMRRAGTIALFNRSICPISKHRAKFFTTERGMVEWYNDLGKWLDEREQAEKKGGANE